MKNSDWISLREAYTDWVAEWPKSSGIRELFQWRGYSLWWSTNLVAKDSYINYGWLAKLCNRVIGANIRLPESNSKRRGPVFLLIIFVVDLLRFLLVKGIEKRQLDKEIDVFMYSLDINLQHQGGVVRDRHYSTKGDTVLLGDVRKGYHSAYLLKISILVKDFLRPLSWRKKLIGTINSMERPVYLADQYIRLVDLFAIHFAVWKAWINLKRVKNHSDFRAGFSIKGVACDDILIDELEQSFYGGVQSSLMQALMIRNFLSDLGENRVSFVNYLEMTSVVRPCYHFVRTLPAEHQLIAMQHGVLHRNKLGFYYRRDEFSYDFDGQSIEQSACPDFYFVHGRQFYDIAKEFYPEQRMRMIGFLKYDGYKEMMSRQKELKSKMEEAVGKKENNIIVLTPTIGVDVTNLLQVFCDREEREDYRVIMSPHPLAKHEEIERIACSMGLSGLLEFYPEYNTQDLVFAADVVVCGYSSTGLEALIFSVPSIRVIDERTIPFVEDEPAIPYVYDADEFWLAVDRLLNETSEEMKDMRRSKMISDYLYRLDGGAMNRFWDALYSVDRLRGERIN